MSNWPSLHDNMLESFLFCLFLQLSLWNSMELHVRNWSHFLIFLNPGVFIFAFYFSLPLGLVDVYLSHWYQEFHFDSQIHPISMIHISHVSTPSHSRGMSNTTYHITRYWSNIFFTEDYKKEFSCLFFIFQSFFCCQTSWLKAVAHYHSGSV